ncbi:MAG: hypothetical protein K0Q79_364 [Flavipsychrobacter sp.]|jgi:catalase|nr:hypothetical protein [Flavipsychrobacter sp.]
MASSNTDLLPGKEYARPDEQVYIDGMIADLKRHLEELYPKGEKMLKHAHPKMHGYVKAEFTVLDNIDGSLKVGLFQVPKTYSAYIRFSNGESKVQPDAKKDVRGMAIKISDAPGRKLLDDAAAAGVQDFIMIDNETFMSKDIKEFHGVMHALTRSKLRLILFLLNPMHFSTLGRLMKFRKQCRHVLDSNYYSVTPYLLGEGRAVKYHARPANGGPLEGNIDKKDDNYLRTNMIKTLSVQDVVFDFFVQVQTDANTMPVEDPTVKWNSPFIKVASIRIPRQEFDTDERNEMGTDASFSPWHSTAEHRPLGGFNRARKEIYYVMSKFRQKHSRGHTTGS